MSKYFGTYDELQQVINNTGIKGDWHELPNEHKQFRTIKGAILNWWGSSKTLQFQGLQEEKVDLETKFNKAAEGEALLPPKSFAGNGTKIFLVHGHDTEARDQLELILHRLNLSPFVLQNNSGYGLTIIEALEDHIKNGTEFGIVLMTPDDVGYPKDNEKQLQPRARQNVVLEMGMLISSLGRGNVAILKKGHLELPSDASGILYYDFHSHVREVVPKLLAHMRNARIDISHDAITKAMQ